MSYTDVPAADRQSQAETLAGALGAGWTLTDASRTPAEWHDWRLRHADGYELDLSWPTAWHGKPARLEIRGCWPVAADGQIRYLGSTAAVPRIEVAQSRPAAAIAGEIRRRLLPAFVAAWQEARKWVADSDAYAATTAETAAALLVALGPTAHRSQHSRDTIYGGANSYVYAVQASGGEVRFESLHCPLAVALRVIAVLGRPNTGGA